MRVPLPPPSNRAPVRLSLLSRFGLISLVMLITLGVVVGIRLASIQRDRTLDDATRAAEVVAQVGIQPLFTTDDLDRNFLPLDPERVAELDDVLLRTVNGQTVVRLKIWNAQRWIIYSDNPRLLGRWFPGDDDLDRSLRGETVSTITDLSAPEEMEERDFGRLLAVYVPLRVDAAGELTTDDSGDVIGAFEIYLPYAPLAAAIAADTRELVLALGIGLLALYLGLFRLVAGASRRLRSQARANEYQATHDALTGLPNRRRLDAVLDAALARRPADEVVALVSIDLDRFKVVNDTLGHGSGDHVLRTIALRLVGAAGDDVFVARLGGDEFALVATGSTDDAIAAVERTLGAIEAPVDVQGLNISVAGSAGLVVGPHDGTDAETLLRRADIAMYVAKDTHTGLHRYAPDDDHYRPEQLALAADLRRALHTDELFLVYQPKLHLRTGAVVGVEALVRWRHPEHGIVPPDRFIPLVENSDLIGPFTRHIVDLALEQQQIWRSAGHSLAVAINVSARDVADERLLNHVADQLRRRDLDPALLELELTESAVVSDVETARRSLQAFQNFGVHIALDDFGTGYASIGNLTGLPIDVVKIDRAFVQNVVADRASQAVVGFSVDLADHLGLQVVAEGVEDQATLEHLRELGCDVVQGYHVSRPLDPEALVEWLVAHETVVGSMA